MTCGVVVREWYAVPGRPAVRLEKPATVAELVDACPGVTSLLVHSSAHRWLGLPAKLPKVQRGRHAFLATARTSDEELGWRVSARAEGRGTVPVVLLGYDIERLSGPWADVKAPAEIVDGLELFERHMRIPWRDGIGRTAERLILSTHPRERGGTSLDRNPSTPPPCEDGTLEQPYRWRRQLTGREARAEWVHVFDQNAQYLAAWQQVHLGLGEPEQLGPNMYDPKRYGIWRTNGNPDPCRPFHPGRYVRPQPDVSEGDWRTGITLERWAECVDLPPIREGWVWPHRARYLRSAAERMRDARAELLEAPGAGAALALDAIKRLYGRQTGRFNMSGRNEFSPWRRPDFGHAVRAQARVNLHRRLAKLAAAPFAIDVDGLAFLTDVPDPVKWAELLGLPLGTGLGTFTIEHSVRANDEIRGASSAAATFAAIRAREREV